MPNWKNIEKLRDHLKALRQTKYRRFCMAGWISGDWWEATIREIRANGPGCGTSACLAGETVIRFAPMVAVVDDLRDTIGNESIPDFAARKLGLDLSEADYVFLGKWSKAGFVSHDTTKAEAIRYLTKALKEKDIFVRVGDGRNK